MFTYPTTALTNWQVLYSSLGSFWTNLFSEKNTIKGYTIGLAEETIQRYYSLLEAVNGYSVYDIPVFNRTRWQAIPIKKSTFNSANFVFEENQAVFGAQTDPYYKGITFKLGQRKIPSAQIYVLDAGTSINDFSILADAVINPSNVFSKGVDVITKNNLIYFNNDLFTTNIPKVNLFDTDGSASTFTDSTGNKVQDQLIILWAYNSKVDVDNLQGGFGNILGINLPSSDNYKLILREIFKLCIDGPTLANISSAIASFLGVATIQSDVEVVEQIINDGVNKIVVTDKNVYTFELFHNVIVSVGTTLNLGDSLVDTVKIFDSVSQPAWWKTELGSKVGLSDSILVGNYNSRLFVKNDYDLLTTDISGNIAFPVEGDPADVTSFQAAMNNPTVKAQLGIKTVSTNILINPVDFIFSNYLSNCTSLIKLTLDYTEATSEFFELLKLIQKYLPKHVYFIIEFGISMVSENYPSLNDSTNITFNSGTQLLNADGSNNNGEVVSLAPSYFKDVKSRLFAIGRSPHTPSYSAVSNPTVDTVADMRIIEGTPIDFIPDGSTTYTFPYLKIIDFNDAIGTDSELFIVTDNGEFIEYQ